MAALSQIALRRLPSFRSVGLKSVNKAATAFHISQSRATLAACRSFSDTAGPLAVARDMCEVDNETLVELSIEGSVDASEERLIREIMGVDEIEWDQAKKKFDEIQAANSSGMFTQTVPYKIGIVGVTAAAFATIPLCFDLNTCLVFNEQYVTTEVAQDKDLETWLEVGQWSWNWMEPPLGQLSFFLLCLQYSRAQMEKIGFKPFTQNLITRRAQKLSSKYGQYRKDIVEDYSINKGLR